MKIAPKHLKFLNTYIGILILGALVLLGLFFFKERSLDIVYEEGFMPANIEYLSNNFTKGRNTTVNLKKIPKGELYNYFFTEAPRKGDNIDILIAPPEWIGQSVQENLLIDLSRFVYKKHLQNKLYPSCLNSYSKYPQNKESYWGIPFNIDSLGFAYRSDLLNNKEERQNFYNLYGYELNPPKTWEELKDIAEFFHRPEEGIYGLSMPEEEILPFKDFVFFNILFAWGEELGNSFYNVDGIINSKKAQAAMNFYNDLKQYTSPLRESPQDLLKNKSAINITLISKFSEFTDSTSNTTDKISFINPPKGPGGESYSLSAGRTAVIPLSAKHPGMAKNFLSWFMKEKTQKKWLSVGGMTCNKNILGSNEYHTGPDFNGFKASSVILLKSFWKIPVYKTLLSSFNKYLNDFSLNKRSALESVDKIAEEWKMLLQDQSGWNIEQDHAPEQNRKHFVYLEMNSSKDFWGIIRRSMFQETNKRNIRLSNLAYRDPNRKFLDKETLKELLNKIEPIDGIIITTATSEAEGAFELAKEKNIPVVLIDSLGSRPEIIASVQSNNYEAGKMSAEYLIEQTSEDDPQILVLAGSLSEPHGLARANGTFEVLEKNNITAITEDTGWLVKNAQSALNEILNANKVSGITAASDAMAMGTIETLKSKGLEKSIPVVGMDGIPDALKLVKNNELAGLYMQPFRNFAVAAVEALLKYSAGRNIPKKIILPGQIITPDNAHLFLTQ